ncbi:hypothetical protein EWM64_g5519 [Hericium alpestre]|uniref:DUF6535 domain-containing protein n=1 Tax=Hericium alpestre TaxID=135208 RepID=A0A4Y9ZWS6_9AGAM|nr:hypothetical protein EWM64_g5519 [Hericium alpestre]
METIVNAVTPKTIQLDFSKDPLIGHVTEYSESSAKIWTIYVNMTQKYDKALVESWKGDMDGILTFAGEPVVYGVSYPYADLTAALWDL